MATEETVQLNEAHEPQQASIDAFESILDSIKSELIKIRHDHDKHEPEYFRLVKQLNNSELASFSASDVVSVRAGQSAYGLHIFGKLKIPTADNAYIHVRIFGAAKEGTDGSSLDERIYTLHSIHTEEVIKADGDHVYRAIFGKDDILEWFDT